MTRATLTATILASGALLGCGSAGEPPEPAAVQLAEEATLAGASFSGEGLTGGGSWWVRWSTAEEGIPHLEPFRLRVEVRRSKDGPAAEAAVQVFADAAMPHHGHGMNLVPRTRPLGEGRYEIEGMLFHMDGRWELFIDVEDRGVLERAQWTVNLD